MHGQVVYIHLSARNLKNLNNLYLSDTQCRVLLDGNVLGITEVAKHNLNPDWQTAIPAVFHFNRRQKLHFEVFDANQDIVGKLTQLAINGEQKKSFIGSTKKALSKLMGAPKSLTRLILKENDEDRGNLVVYINRTPPPQVVKQPQYLPDIAQQLVQPGPQAHVDTDIYWRWGGTKLLDMDFFSKSDPFARFFKFTEGNRILFYQTETIKNDLNPEWKEWKAVKEDLFQFQEIMQVEVWDYDKSGGHDFIGDVTISYQQIKSQNQRIFQLLTKKGKDAGKLRIIDLKIVEPPPPPPPKPAPEPEPIPEPIPEPPREPTFLDYLMAQWQLSMLIGIDFTFSNQPITKADSLHKISDNKLNYYQQAIKYIGGAVISFDYDKKVPVYGFGGVPKMPKYTRNTMDECFPLNGDPQDPTCEDVAGILKAYAENVSHIQFSGPTFVSKVLQGAYELGAKNQKENIYTVALLMTDGQIEDLEDAVKIIAKCSELPMSIIIIGVGDENFKYMKQLDDTKFIQKTAKIAQEPRDIVQFVSYQEMKNDIEVMSAAVLDNLPKQFMSYMQLHNILPEKLGSVHLSQAFMSQVK